MKRILCGSVVAAAVVMAAGCASRSDVAQPQTQDNFGVRMAKQNLWREAMFRFRRAVEINPNDAMAHNNLAVAYEANGDFDNARKEYLEALKLDRSNAYIPGQQRRRDAAGPAAGTAAFLLALLSLPALAGVEEVKLKLPLKPKLQIAGDEKIAIAPFVIANNGEKKSDRAQKIDVQAEFQRYLRKQLTKSTKLRLVDVPVTRLPGTDMQSLEAARDFWKDLGAKPGADFIVCG